MSLLISLALTTQFRFAGGTIQELVQSLSAFRQESCIAEIYDGDQLIPAFRCDGSNEGLQRVVLKASGYTLSFHPQVCALTSGFVNPTLFNFRGEKFNRQGRAVSIPGSSVSPIGVDSKYRSLQRMSKDALKPNEVVSLDTKKREFTTIADLQAFNTLKADWKAAWPYKNVPLALAVHGLSAASFLKEVAWVEGARLQTTKKLIDLQFSAANYRQRFINSSNDPVLFDFITSTGEVGNTVLARLKFRKDAIKYLSDSFLEQNFADTPLGKAHNRVDFDGNPMLKSTCTQFAYDLISAAREDIRAGRDRDPSSIADTNSVDNDAKPRYLLFIAPAQFYINVHARDDKHAFLWG